MMNRKDWRPTARQTNNDLIDRMADTIRMAVDMRASERDEETLTLALAERVELMKVLLTMTFDGVFGDF